MIGASIIDLITLSFLVAVVSFQIVFVRTNY